MALLIEKDINIFGDISISQLYVRLIVNNGPSGTPLIVRGLTYSSKSSYDSDPNSNNFTTPDFPHSIQFTYDREIDGSDVLGFAHNELKTFLSTDRMIDVPVLDPSTGAPTYDPSTGELITESVISIPKFAEDSSIFIVDVSIL